LQDFAAPDDFIEFDNVVGIQGYREANFAKPALVAAHVAAVWASSIVHKNLLFYLFYRLITLTVAGFFAKFSMVNLVVQVRDCMCCLLYYL
jgi:hypothetical protein